MKRSKVFKQVNDHTTELYDRVTKIETEILDKITRLKKQKSKNLFLCEHLSLQPECHQFDPKIDYYDLFWKTFLLNEVKKSKVENFTLECQSMADNIKWIEKKFNKYHRLVSYRLTSTNISFSESGCNQKFICKISGCGKSYQSLGALDLHHKIKHQSQRSDQSESSIVKNMKGNMGIIK